MRKASPSYRFQDSIQKWSRVVLLARRSATISRSAVSNFKCQTWLTSWEHQIYYLLILISRGKTLCRPSPGSSEVTRRNWPTPSVDPVQSLTSEKLTRHIAREPWQAVPSIYYQRRSCSRLLVTYISLVTAFSLSNPGKCVQFGTKNRKVLEIVSLAPARGGGREVSRRPDCARLAGAAGVACRRRRRLSVWGVWGRHPLEQHCQDRKAESRLYVYINI